MKIEVLFPELSNIYGDTSNIKYFAGCVDDVEIINTHNWQQPKFISEKIDFVYIGSMTEAKQQMAITRLMPFKQQIWQSIQNDQVMLATGNSIEIFGKYIIDKISQEKTKALGLFDYYAQRDMEERHNSLFVGTFDDIKIVGNKAQFSFCYGNIQYPFIKKTGGFGLNPEFDYEGIHYKNFFATYLLGPLLVLNPYFTKYLLCLLKEQDHLLFEQQCIEAYDYRLECLEKPNTRFLMGDHG